MSTLTIRTDPEVEDALEALTTKGQSRSEAARPRYSKPNVLIDAPGCVPRRKRYAMIPMTSPRHVTWLPRWMLSVRGDVYRLKAPSNTRGHERAGTRHAVVVQSDDLPLSTWLVAPTSTGRRAASFRPEVEIDGTKTRVMIEQLTAVDAESRLGDFAGRLDRSEMVAVDTALRAVLGLD